MGTGVVSPGVKRCRGLTLTTHPYLVPRSRMSRGYTSSPASAYMPCSGTALHYFHFYSHIGIDKTTSSETPHFVLVPCCKSCHHFTSKAFRQYVYWTLLVTCDVPLQYTECPMSSRV
jgi:hypothetical protein